MARHIPQDTRYVQCSLVEPHQLPQRIGIAKVFAGHRLRKYHAVLPGQCRLRIAYCEWQRKHPEHAAVGEPDVRLVKGSLAMRNQWFDAGKSHGVNHRREPAFQVRGKLTSAVGCVLELLKQHDPVGVAVKPVVVQFIEYIGRDEQTTRQAEGQARYVDERRKPVFADVAPGDFEVVAKHGLWYLVIFEKTDCVMETEIEYSLTDESQDEKRSSFNHSELQSHLSFLFRAAYRTQYSILTELDFSFASGKTRPDLCIMPKRKVDWLADEIVMQDVPLTTIEILSPCDGPPEQSLSNLTDRICKKHFPAGVKSVWLVVPTIQTVSILLPDRRQVNVASGTVVDPVTGIQLELSDIFEG